MKRFKNKDNTKYEVTVTMRDGNSIDGGTQQVYFLACWVSIKTFIRLLHSQPAKVASYKIAGGCFDNINRKILWAADTRGMRKVSKEEFYNTVGNMDVVLSVQTAYGYPYTTNWNLRNGNIKGKTVDRRDEARPGFTLSDYFVNL